MTARTLQALRFLGLLDGDYGSELFDGLRRATGDEVPGLLASILRRAYPTIFVTIDPSSAADHELAEAFCLFEPAAQRPKMIALFRGLCVMAGIIRPDAPARPAAAKRNQARASRRAAPTRSAFELDPVIRAVVDALPPARRWSPAQRERWLEALRAAVDLTIEVTPPAGS